MDVAVNVSDAKQFFPLHVRPEVSRLRSLPDEKLFPFLSIQISLTSAKMNFDRKANSGTVASGRGRAEASACLLTFPFYAFIVSPSGMAETFSESCQKNGRHRQFRWLKNIESN